MNRWADGLADWQFVALTVGLCGLVATVEGVLMVLITGHLDLADLVLRWGVFTPIFCAICVHGRRWRKRHARL